MPNPFAPETRPPRQIRLSGRGVLAFATALTFVSGTLFSSAAMGAGVTSPDLLALIFALGGCSMLFLLLLWYLAQLARAEGERTARNAPHRRFVDQRSPWTQPRRPPSGSTIMWAMSALRRKAGPASLR